VGVPESHPQVAVAEELPFPEPGVDGEQQQRLVLERIAAVTNMSSNLMTSTAT